MLKGEKIYPRDFVVEKNVNLFLVGFTPKTGLLFIIFLRIMNHALKGELLFRIKSR